MEPQYQVALASMVVFIGLAWWVDGRLYKEIWSLLKENRRRKRSAV